MKKKLVLNTKIQKLEPNEGVSNSIPVRSTTYSLKQTKRL